ncbi:MAG: N-glycosylase/DNA lyase [Candidatus Omnitrophota bacterium]
MVLTAAKNEKIFYVSGIKNLVREYAERGPAIRKRLRDFVKVWDLPDEKIFSELCFCICTPQSKAVYCDKAVKGLEKSGQLFTGGIEEIRNGLTAVRFPNNKARYIFSARESFSVSGRVEIKKTINTADIPGTRDDLVRKVKGIGYKEASHFLRNIGHGGDLAILDVHIIKNMVRYGLLDRTPSCISKSCYLEMEESLKRFSVKVGIPMGELDILFWSIETGVIFK